MKKSVYNFSLICGLLLTLAAFPVFAQDSDIQINKKPLQSFGKTIYEENQKSVIDLKAPFSLTMQGKFDKNGKFDANTKKFTKSEGDAGIIEIAKQGIEFVNDSGIFSYLKHLGINEAEIALVQTDKDFSVDLKSSLDSENLAKKVTSGINLIIQTGKVTVKDENSKALLENSKVESIGKDFLLKFSMPLEQFHGMINRELEKVK